jgi:signal transduction histidine kinase/ActR/RegA family two-component response regulator
VKLSTRLVASFIAVGAITMLLGVFAVNRLSTVHAAGQLVEEVRLPSSRIIAAMDAEIAKIRMAELQHVLSTTPAQRRWYARDTDNLLASLAHDRTRFMPLIDTPAERELYRAFAENWYRYLVQHDSVFVLSDSGHSALAKTIMRGSSQTTFDRASAKLQELIELTVQAGTDATQRSEAEYSLSRSFIIACSAATLLFGMGLAFLLMRSITRPLNALGGAAERIEGGDLSQRVAIHTRDEFGRLAETFNRMAEALGSAQDTLEQRVADRTIELHVAKEAHREARDLAEMANQAKSEFLSNMSHELRTPLNSVIGFSDILLKNRANNFTEKDLGYVDRIQANGRHLLTLINSVLDLSKVEAGHMELEITSVSLGDFAREVLAELEPQAAARNVRMSVEFPDALCLLDTDRGKLEQILTNLVGNAVKFSAEREVRVVVCADPVSGQPLRIDVVDTGIGIPAERMASIFEAFQQADNSTARHYGGTGLGLTISRSLAQLLGFDIMVTSEVGVGSTFSIVFMPERIGASVVTSIGMVRPAVLAGPSLQARDDGEFLVLVIDDESDARVILKRSFEDLGCSVVTAASVDEGLALARTVSPGMITVDLMMPHKNGWDALRELQADPVLRSIPVIVVSAVASENRAQLFGALDSLDKPVTREALARVIGRNRAAFGHPVRRTA